MYDIPSGSAQTGAQLKIRKYQNHRVLQCNHVTMKLFDYYIIMNKF